MASACEESDMIHEKPCIKTPDGLCQAHLFRSDGQERLPAVLLFMDGIGIRPTLFMMAERLASAGYVVLLPDTYYRFGPYPPLDAKAVFASEEAMAKLGVMLQSIDNRRVAQDARHFIAYLDGRSDIAGHRIGTTGYCMGGGMALTVAGTYPDRIAAAASFHGGYLASDLPDSPHLLAPQMRARIYVAGADKDDYYPPEMAERLEAALTDAGVDHRCEIYAGALHGWTMADFPVYDPQAAERHWDELIALFDGTLK
jgi:carboxymethylenebutenolidase